MFAVHGLPSAHIAGIGNGTDDRRRRKGCPGGHPQQSVVDNSRRIPADKDAVGVGRGVGYPRFAVRGTGEHDIPAGAGCDPDGSVPGQPVGARVGKHVVGVHGIPGNAVTGVHDGPAITAVGGRRSVAANGQPIDAVEHDFAYQAQILDIGAVGGKHTRVPGGSRIHRIINGHDGTVTHHVQDRIDRALAHGERVGVTNVGFQVHDFEGRHVQAGKIGLVQK